MVRKSFPSQTVFPRFAQLIALVGSILLSPIVVGSAAAQTISADTSNRASFSIRMEKIDASCRPPGTSITRDSYTYKLVMALGRECVGENLTIFNAAKYVSLIGVTAASVAVQAHPATAALAATTVAELKSDGAKCVVRALIESSDERADWKVKWKARAMAGFSAYDWQQFAKAMPSLADGGKLQAVGGAMRDGYGAWERGTELGDFANLIAVAVQEGEDALNTYRHGATDTVLRRFKQQRAACDYRAARSSLNQAYLTAQAECEAYAANYSFWDAKRTDYIDQHYVTRNNSGGARAIVNNTIKSYANSAQSAANDLENFAAIFETFEALGKALVEDEHAVKQDQDEYRNQLGLTRRELDTSRACYAIGDLRSKLADISKNFSDECRSNFYRRLRADGVPLPDDVQAQMVNAAHLRVGKWWDQLDEIRHLYRDCKPQEGASKVSNLRREISSNPVMAVVGNDCGPVEQPHLLAALSGLKEPAYCENTTVPQGLVGAPLSSAYKLLDEAELFVGGDLVRVEPQEGQLPDTVIASDPASGETVRVWTGVKLTVIAAPPEVEMVSVPEVVGKTKIDATNVLTGADLVAVIDDSKPADKIEFVADQVYGASHATGAMVAPQSVVTLNVYGPRPMIKIPGIAAPDIATANGQISAAGFVPGKPALGKPAPALGIPTTEGADPALALGEPALEGGEPGAVYGSVPPAGTMAEMFSSVQPLVYGPRINAVETRPIPEVLGKPAEKAIGILTADGFFTIGSVSPGNPVGKDEKPGTVQTVIPGQGTPQVKGTAVALRIAMPRADEEPAADPETTPQEQEDTTESDDDSWVGRWHLEAAPGEVVKGLDKPMMLDIAQIDGKLSLQLFVQKDGAWDNRISLLLVANSNNVLHTHPDMIREFQSSLKPSPNSNGVLDEVGGEIAETILLLLETLEISRSNGVCSLNMTDKKKGPQTVRFSCVKTGPSQQ